MPTYDYECDACGHNFEEFQPMTARPLRKCPSCEELKLRRLIGTGGGVIFKGSGFYQTDYRSDSYNKAKNAEKPEKADSSKADGGAKKEPKPESSAAASDSAKSDSSCGSTGKDKD